MRGIRHHRRARSGGRRGIALLMTLIAVFLMVLLVSDFMENTTVFVATGANARDEVQAVYLARSAINLSRLLLVMQPTINRQLRSFGMPSLPLWRYADMMLAAFSEPGAASGLGMMLGASMGEAEGMGVEFGSFTARIVDEDSKINLNLGAQPRMADLLARELAALVAPAVYNPLFEESDASGNFTDRETNVQAIIDWADLDTEPYGFDSGTEDGFYELLTPSYHRRNAPFDSLEELRMIRGVDEDYWTAFVEPNADDPDQRLITVWGAGRININTATPLVLAALICTFAANQPEPACDPASATLGAFALAQYAAMYRDAGGLMPGLGAFSSARQFTSLISDGVEGIVQGVPLNEQEALRHLGVESRVFSVYATGEVGRVRRTIHTVIHTGLNPNEGGAVLYWRED
jgi:general secretion pathway protein K